MYKSDLIQISECLLGPGSFLEVSKVLPLLTKSSKRRPSFHVVALSLPGFGFSEAPTKKGFHAFKYAEVCNNLMLELGYPQYGMSSWNSSRKSKVLTLRSVSQGGDWGAWVSQDEQCSVRLTKIKSSRLLVL